MKKKLVQIKKELMKPDWTEGLHHTLEELPQVDVKKIVESMTESEIYSKVNNRRFQQDYIADYIEYLWNISRAAYWKHVIVTLDSEVGILWSDNMSHFEKMCTHKLPIDVFDSVLNFIIESSEVHNEIAAQDIEAIGCVIKAQVEKFDGGSHVESYISSLEDSKRLEIKQIIDNMVKTDCTYQF